MDGGVPYREFSRFACGRVSRIQATTGVGCGASAHVAISIALQVRDFARDLQYLLTNAGNLGLPVLFGFDLRG